MPAIALRIRKDLRPPAVRGLPLNVYVALNIAILLLVFGATVVFYNYRHDRDAAYAEAERVFASASDRAVAEVRALFGPVSAMVDLTARLPHIATESIKSRWNTIPFIVEALRGTPAISAIYAGYDDGEFFLVRNLRGDPRIHEATAAPVEAKFVVQSIDRVDGSLRQTFHYLDDDLNVIDRNRRFHNGFDPRQRLWYHAADGSGATALSPVYVFATTRELGATLSRRLPGGGVVGADMALTHFAERLDALKIGERGRILIFTGRGRVAVTNDPDALLTAVRIRPDGSSVQPLVTELDDPVVAGSYAGYARSGTGRTLVNVVDGEEWLSRFTEMNLAKTTMTLGILAPGELFLADSERTAETNLLVSLFMLILALPAAWLIGRLIARPIRALTDETARIRRFELDDDLDIRSPINEVRRLGESMRTMKSSLRDLARFVPRQLVRDLVAGRTRAALGGERREISLMFTDIAGYTTLAENLDPQALMEKTSAYFERVGGAIIQHGGTIDKYIGDAIMAFWNAPETQHDHAAMLCEAALAASAASREFDRELEERGEPPMFTRFGLHLGTAVVGNVGSVDRMDFTVLGAVVNLASRLEGLNKVYGTQVLVSGAVRDRVADRYLFRPVDSVVPKGALRAMPVFELVASLDDASSFAADSEHKASVTAWCSLYELYLERRWGEVETALDEYVTRWPADPLGPRLRKRVRGFREAPPPSGWDGAKVMKSK